MVVNARTTPRVKGNRLVKVNRSADGDTTTIATYQPVEEPPFRYAATRCGG